ncbi:hypothetical protein [Hyphococcus sp.]|uniref:hypothetical protein n=1 Tax=Hyphococcus sp. TaxID=2038636 RepID=UPI003CCBC0FF
MTKETGPKPTMLRMIFFSVLVSTFVALLMLGSGYLEYGWEKVLNDIWIYIGLFVFLIVVITSALLLSARFGNRKK